MSTKEIWKGGAIFLGVILIGAIIYTKIEGWNFLDSIYFSAVTITTLGYGDIVPVTTFGKIFTIFFSISGIAIGLFLLTKIGKSFFEIRLKKGVSKAFKIEEGKKFHISKLRIGDKVVWNPRGKGEWEGDIVEIRLEQIKVDITKKNNQIIPKKDQKILTITSKGRLKNNASKK